MSNIVFGRRDTPAHYHWSIGCGSVEGKRPLREKIQSECDVFLQQRQMAGCNTVKWNRMIAMASLNRNISYMVNEINRLACYRKEQASCVQYMLKYGPLKINQDGRFGLDANRC